MENEEKMENYVFIKLYKFMETNFSLSKTKLFSKGIILIDH